MPGSERPPGERNGNPSSLLAWRSPRTAEPGWLRPWGRMELDVTERLSTACHPLEQKPLRGGALFPEVAPLVLGRGPGLHPPAVCLDGRGLGGHRVCPPAPSWCSE